MSNLLECNQISYRVSPMPSCFALKVLPVQLIANLTDTTIKVNNDYYAVLFVKSSLIEVLT
jgi:hypothetical protein